MLKRIFERESEHEIHIFRTENEECGEKKNMSMEKENKRAQNSQQRNHRAKEESHLLYLLSIISFGTFRSFRGKY